MFTTRESRVYTTVSAGAFMQRVYTWMCAGLLLTSGMSAYIFANPQIVMQMFKTPLIWYGLMALQVGLVVYLNARIMRMSYFAASLAFSLYAISLGITLSPILLVYTAASVAQAFLIAAGMFGAMAFYGYYTNTDLSRFGSILLMALLGLVIATVVNAFVQSSGADLLLSYVSVLLFAALTAYDVQKIQQMGYALSHTYDSDDDATVSDRVAVLGALMLYLDFINLFIHLVHILGKKRR